MAFVNGIGGRGPLEHAFEAILEEGGASVPNEPESARESVHDDSFVSEIDWAEMDLHMERGVVMGAEIYQRELGIPYDDSSEVTRRLEYLILSYVSKYCGFNSYDDPINFCIRFAMNLAASFRAQGTSRVPRIRGEVTTTSAPGSDTDAEAIDSDSKYEADDEKEGGEDEGDISEKN